MFRYLSHGLAALIAMSASAQPSDRAVRVGLHAEAAESWFTISDPSGIRDRSTSMYDPGFGGGIQADLNFKAVSLRCSLDFIHFGINRARVVDYFEPDLGNLGKPLSSSGGDMSLLALKANLMVPIYQWNVISGYFVAGTGVTWITRDAMTVSSGPFAPGAAGLTLASESQGPCPLVDVGIGFDVDIGLQLFIEVEFAWQHFAGSSEYLPVSLGVIL